MVATLVSTVLAELARYARDRCGPRLEKMALFGSFARGQGDLFESDVDVLVVVRGLERREHWDIVNEGARISAVRGIQVSPLVLSSERWEEMRQDDLLLYREIEREGIVV